MVAIQCAVDTAAAQHDRAADEEQRHPHRGHVVERHRRWPAAGCRWREPQAQRRDARDAAPEVHRRHRGCAACRPASAPPRPSSPARPGRGRRRSRRWRWAEASLTQTPMVANSSDAPSATRGSPARRDRVHQRGLGSPAGGQPGPSLPPQHQGPSGARWSHFGPAGPRSASTVAQPSPITPGTTRGSAACRLPSGSGTARPRRRRVPSGAAAGVHAFADLVVLPAGLPVGGLLGSTNSRSKAAISSG